MEEKTDAPHTLSVTAANGTDDREARPKHWIAVLVQIRSEKAVGKKLDGLEIENYVPTQWEYHQWSDRKKKVERVVIPMIVFIHTDKAIMKQLATYSFINKVLTYPGQSIPAIIPDTQIESLKFMLKQSDSQIEMHNHLFKTGDVVRIMRGPLKGLEGELCRMQAEKPMVAVQINGLGYACVSIEKSDIKVIARKSEESPKGAKSTKTQKTSPDK